MHKVTFFPLENADSILIEVNADEAAEKLILFDYANVRDANNEDDKRCDLEKLLRSKLAAKKRNSFDVVAFSHLDSDHIYKAGEFFYFEHSPSLQSDTRPKIKELWVPAAVLVEDECDGDAAIIQKEARRRFKNKSGIRVFSQPKSLTAWMSKNGLKWDDHKHLVTDAGNCVPGFTDRKTQGVEFFVHSPFGHRQDDNEVVVRNDDCLVMQATFYTPGHLGGRDTRLILSADITHGVISEIVQITKKRKREDRLKWDIFKLPHHCSYLSLGPEKGTTKTEPVADVKWWFEQGEEGGIIVSTSKIIPTGDTDQPPHVQTARTHRDRASSINGEFKVTMEHPSKTAPEPLVLKIDNFGVTPDKPSGNSATPILGAAIPRAGSSE